jgi:prophage tail gpP-like protein
MPNPEEVAVLRVEGMEFDDWTTVWVQDQWAEAYPLFRFSCAERDPIPEWPLLQFKPGDRCFITLGGQPAVDGVIMTRQVAYDAGNHGVQLSGKGKQFFAASSSVNTKTNSFDKMTLKQIADKLYKGFPTPIKTVGKLDETPFENAQAQPGETNWDFLERLARSRSCIMGSDHEGNQLLIGDHTFPVRQQLMEGWNILKMQCVHNIDMVSTNYVSRSQTNGTDDQHGRAASEMEARAKGKALREDLYKYLEFPAEQGVKSQAELQQRVNFEAIIREGTVIEATVTVQGWLRDGKQLWRPGDGVFIKSSMAMLNREMKIQTATFQQDSGGGTTTMLLCVLPWKLKGKGFGSASWSEEPEPAKTDTGPPTDPKPDPSKQPPSVDNIME